MPMTIRRYAASMNDWGLLMLRLVVGIVFVMHGGQKLFVKGLPGIELAATGPGRWAIDRRLRLEP